MINLVFKLIVKILFNIEIYVVVYFEIVMRKKFLFLYYYFIVFGSLGL